MPKPFGPYDEPLVIRTLREYREQVDARELDAMRRMADSWLMVERRLEADILALAVEMDRRQRMGEAITQQMVWKAQEYKRLKTRLEDELKRWNNEQLIPQIEAEQRAFGYMGQDAARDALFAINGPLQAPMMPMLNRDAVQVMIGFLGNGAPLNTLLRNDYPDALEGLSNALINGVARGLGAGVVAKEMANGMGMGLERAMLIARTEINRTYRQANINSYRASNVVGGYMRLVKKSTACMACLMLDGQRFELEDDFSDHPRGKCTAVPVLKSGYAPRWQTGPQWFATLTAEEQRAKMGSGLFEAWQEGKFELRDLAKMRHSDVWGDSPRVATLSELVGQGGE